jgi:Fe2+ transport system protein FeoA
MKNLSQCKQHDVATIARIEGSGAFRKRLFEMGFLKGVSVKIIRYAPLKDPIELSIKGSHVSLRVIEAEKIIIQDL